MVCYKNSTTVENRSQIKMWKKKQYISLELPQQEYLLQLTTWPSEELGTLNGNCDNISMLANFIIFKEWESAHNSYRHYEVKLSLLCSGQTELIHQYFMSGNDREPVCGYATCRKSKLPIKNCLGKWHQKRYNKRKQNIHSWYKNTNGKRFWKWKDNEIIKGNRHFWRTTNILDEWRNQHAVSSIL